MKDKLHRFFKKEVELRSPGITYRGVLVGADEEFIYLRGVTGWITLPFDRVSGVRLQNSSEAEWVTKKVDGEPNSETLDRESKKRFSDKDLLRIHQPDENSPWPGGAESDE